MKYGPGGIEIKRLCKDSVIVALSSTKVERGNVYRVSQKTGTTRGDQRSK